MLAPPAPPPHQAPPGEQISGRTGRWPILDLGVPAAQHRAQLPRAPVRVQPAELAQQPGEDRPDLRRARERPSGLRSTSPRLPSSLNLTADLRSSPARFARWRFVVARLQVSYGVIWHQAVSLQTDRFLRAH